MNTSGRAPRASSVNSNPSIPKSSCDGALDADAGSCRRVMIPAANWAHDFGQKLVDLLRTASRQRADVDGCGEVDLGEGHVALEPRVEVVFAALLFDDGRGGLAVLANP